MDDPTKPRRRSVDIAERLDQQDIILGQVHQMIIEHNATHKVTDPALLELIDILRGAKLLKRLAIALAGLLGASWAFVEFIWNHVKIIK